MILVNQHTANSVFPNGGLGEFKIKNSAKAFSILSSGLYANKIRAIIRELSCNAYDSHIAAGNASEPFDIHLPNAFEPYFAIRDYGVGLDHSGVVNVYTTYFESTKTDSNDYIGALGLGSKSPFSYVNTFKVIAIKNGRRGVYTTFINENGVPSIGQESEESTTEENGLEVRLDVNPGDFRRFYEEAVNIFTYFKVQPRITGVQWKTPTVKYHKKDILPGVSVVENQRTTMAVMGNIAYPIEMPNIETNLGSLKYLMNCALEIHFKIGDLDFSASREGLSYIPKTIENIRNRLKEIHTALYSIIEKELDAIPNQWVRAAKMKEYINQLLWKDSVQRYIANKSCPTVDASNYYLSRTFDFFVDDLAKKYNIKINSFRSTSHGINMSNAEKRSRIINNVVCYDSAWRIPVAESVRFVVSTDKTGNISKSKAHWKTISKDNSFTYQVYVIEPEDKSKVADIKAFIAALHFPPEEQITSADKIPKVERTVVVKREKTRLIRLEKHDYHGWKWSGDIDLEQLSNTEKYYYLPLEKWNVLTKQGSIDPKHLRQLVSQSGLLGVDLYGVRKESLEKIKDLPNWINYEDAIVESLSKADEQFLLSVAYTDSGQSRFFVNSQKFLALLKNQDGVYAQIVKKYQDCRFKYVEISAVNWLLANYGNGKTIDVRPYIKGIEQDISKIYDVYPMLKISNLDKHELITDYINLIDRQ